MDTNFGRYRAEEEIGKGGFGVVYRALDTNVHRSVALKVLTVKTTEEDFSRFEAEALTTSRLQHKNIVTVHDYGMQNGKPFIVMELLSGRTLLEEIQLGKGTLLEKVAIMQQVAEGLQYAHGRNVIHRDIKPANIMVQQDGVVKIMDFGIARVIQEDVTRKTQAGVFMGTPAYTAPERFKGESDAKTDIFAFGVVYYELLTGWNPFSGGDCDYAEIAYRVRYVDPPPVADSVAGIPDALDHLISRLIDKDREIRYGSLEAVLRDSRPIFLKLQQQRAEEMFNQLRPFLSTDGGATSASLLERLNEVLVFFEHPEAREWHDRLEEDGRRKRRAVKIAGLRQEGEKHLGARRLREAVVSFENAVRLDKEDSELRHLLEAANEALDRQTKAGRLYAEAVDLDQQERCGEAFEKVQAALENDPENRLANRLRDTLLPKLQKIQAEEELRKKHNQLNLEMQDVQSDLDHGRLGEASAKAERLSREFGPQTVVLELQENIAVRRRAAAVAQALAGADELISQRKFAEAAAELREALRKCPGGDRQLETKLRFAVTEDKAQTRAAAIAQTLDDCRALASAGEEAEALEKAKRAVSGLGRDPALLDFIQKLSAEIEKRKDKLRRDEERRNQEKLREQERLDRTRQQEDERRRAEQQQAENQRRARQSAIAKALTDANAFVRQRLFQDACRVLEQSAGVYPDAPELRQAYDKVQRDWEDFERAERERIAREKADSQRRAREAAITTGITDATAMLQQQRFEQAFDALERLGGDYPDAPEIKQAYAKAQQTREAFERTAQERAEREEAVQEGLEQAAALDARGDLDGSIRVLELLRRRFANEARVSQRYKDAVDRRSVREEARRQEEERVRQEEKERLAQIRLEAITRGRKTAADLLALGDFDGAVRTLEALKAEYPESKEVLQDYKNALRLKKRRINPGPGPVPGNKKWLYAAAALILLVGGVAEAIRLTTAASTSHKPHTVADGALRSSNTPKIEPQPTPDPPPATASPEPAPPSVSESELSFEFDGERPAPQVLKVSGGKDFTASSDQRWLRVAKAGTDEIRVDLVNVAGMKNGTYNGHVEIQTQPQPIEIPVQLQINKTVLTNINWAGTLKPTQTLTIHDTYHSAGTMTGDLPKGIVSANVSAYDELDHKIAISPVLRQDTLVVANHSLKNIEKLTISVRSR